jgi:UDP-glucose 4-epimerase
MTRFLMSLEESVDLVLHAFKNGKQGDIFVQKAPSCTVSDLAAAINQIFKSNNIVKIIGTRHGEKLYETLVSREEMAKAKDRGRYYAIPADNRDLNYDKYILEGSLESSLVNDYTSHNTCRLTVPEVVKTLLSLDYVKKEMLEWAVRSKKNGKIFGLKSEK